MTLAFSALAADATPPVDQREYARPHDLVDVGGGRRLNLYCAGKGSPTVVFDSGSGLAGWDWLLVHSKVATRTRACIYDRAGFGFSDPGDRPGTSANAVDDLHTLLSAANVPAPYVLVGHSYGGTNVQLYAYTYPNDVVGLVNVDGAHEDESARLDRITQGKLTMLMRQYSEGAEACVAAARRHEMAPGSEAFTECVGEPPPMFGGPLAAVYVANRLSRSFWEAGRSEEVNAAVSDEQLRQARKSFGNLPLAYLTRGVSPYLVPGKPQSELNKATERDVLAMHDEIARLSSRGTNRVVPGAGHSIHVDKPQAVIDAIDEVLTQVTAPARSQ